MAGSVDQGGRLDRFGRALAGIERRLAADDPLLAEAFDLWNERCNEVTHPPVAAGEPLWPAVLTLILGASLSGAVLVVPWWLPGWGGW